MSELMSRDDDEKSDFASLRVSATLIFVCLLDWFWGDGMNSLVSDRLSFRCSLRLAHGASKNSRIRIHGSLLYRSNAMKALY